MSLNSTVILRRKPTNWFHVLRWNTQTDQMEHSGWYAGTLYPKRADVSFDGNWLVFLAMAPGTADWACWDCLGQLLFSSKGSVYKFGLDGLQTGTPTTLCGWRNDGV